MTRSISLIALCFLLAPAAPADDLKLHVIDVGQGDGLMLQCPDGTLGMLVDSADRREGDGGIQAWKDYIKPYLWDVESIPLVLASHPHADHIGGLPWLLKKYSVELLVDNGRPYKSKTYDSYREERDKLPVANYDKATTWPAQTEICDGEATVTYWVAPGFTNSACKNDANVCSVFARVDYGDTSFLLTGDAHDESELRILASSGMREWLDVDVLKVGHHGSLTSSDPNFLKAVSPTCIVISAGDRDKSNTNRRVKKQNRWRGYGHPRLKTLSKLNESLLWAGSQLRSEKVWAWKSSTNKWVQQEVNARLAITALDGTVVVSSDGSTVTCR